MKKFILMSLIAMCVTCLCASYAACTVKSGEEHGWDEHWSHDERGHWHECIDGCGQITAYDSHEWEFKSTIDYPTCIDEGLGLYVCKICSEEKEDIIEATGNHLWVNTGRLEPTCYAKGYEERTCALCDYSEKNEIPATEDHAFIKSLWVTVDEHSHGHPCVMFERGCKATSEPEPHNKKSTPTIIQPGEYVDGSQSYDCEICGYQMDITILPATDIPNELVPEFKKGSGGLWQDTDPEPVMTRDENGEYNITLIRDNSSDTANYGYKLDIYGVFYDENGEVASTVKQPNWTSVGSPHGISGYILDETTGEHSSEINWANSFLIYYKSMFRCKSVGTYRTKFAFETGDINRVSVKERVSIIINITVENYSAAKSLTVGSLPVVLDTQPIMYLECSLRRPED